MSVGSFLFGRGLMIGQELIVKVHRNLVYSEIGREVLVLSYLPIIHFAFTGTTRRIHCQVRSAQVQRLDNQMRLG
jgi:hypothetical protein